MKDSKFERIFSYTKVKHKYLARWLRLHGFPVIYAFLYQPINEKHHPAALLRRIERLHRLGFHLHLLLVLPLEQEETQGRNDFRKERLPTMKKLQSRSASASASSHSPFQFAILNISEADLPRITPNSN